MASGECFGCSFIATERNEIIAYAEVQGGKCDCVKYYLCVDCFADFEKFMQGIADEKMMGFRPERE